MKSLGSLICNRPHQERISCLDENLNDFVKETEGECSKPSMAEVCAAQMNLLQLLSNTDVKIKDP